MSKILIFGGAGFIGSRFVEFALEAGHTVMVYDAMTYAGHALNLEAAYRSPEFFFTCGDIRNADTVRSAVRDFRPDVMVNFAAESHVDRSIRDAHTFVMTNILGTHVLLEAARFADKPPRFYEISTDECYGDAEVGEQFTVDSQIKPSNPYAASKASADLLALAYQRTYGMDIVISRSSNNYGPRQHPEKLIPMLITRLLDGDTIPLHGTGKQIRDWIHVDDHCRAIMLVMTKGIGGQVYNVGGGTQISNLEVLGALCEVLQTIPNKVEHVADRWGGDMAYRIDPTKIEAELGWRRQVDFMAGLRATVEWYAKNEDWRKAVLEKSR